MSAAVLHDVPPQTFDRPKTFDIDINERKDNGAYNVLPDDFDRGHLFPFSYGRTRKQAFSTMRLSNVVPQASLFNSGLWSSGERSLKNIFLAECFGIGTGKTKTGYKAILMTGAVPAYLGKKVASVNDRLLFKLGGNQFLRENKFTVPTHMWTQAVCLDANQVGWVKLVSQTSLIGMNYKRGRLARYDDGISNLLREMYAPC